MMSPRPFLAFALLASALPVFGSLTPHNNANWVYTNKLAREDVPNHLQILEADSRLNLEMHPSTVILSGDGRQPYLFCSAQGTLFCQAQETKPPFRTKDKQVYLMRIDSAISRDGGKSWSRWTHQADHDDVNIEGGMAQLRDGTILALDTFVMEGKTPGHGIGEIWKSHDDLRTWEGPFWVDFKLPHIAWSGSTNDIGQHEASARVHRSLLELPNGDLLTTMYCRFDGDTAPAAYMPTMLKSRTIIVRSRDHGSNWAYLATVGVDSGMGTEGFGEPVLARVDRGVHAGRLICIMRTGRMLHQSYSDDNGEHWEHPFPMRLPGIDVYNSARWEKRFGYDPHAPDYVPRDDMIGSMTDPELIQMRSGVLVCGFGFRAPEKRYSIDWHAQENGDYIAFSLDGGDTWSEILQFRSGAPTTHYMGIRESKPGILYVAYDDNIWQMPGNAQGFELDVRRSGDKP